MLTCKDFLQELNDFLDRNNFPMEYDADTLFNLIKNDTYKPSVLLDYLEDANEQLFDTPVIGAEVYLSEDSGKTWQKQNNGLPDNSICRIISIILSTPMVITLGRSAYHLRTKT